MKNGKFQIGDKFKVPDPWNNGEWLIRTCVGFNGNGDVIAKENGHLGWDKGTCKPLEWSDKIKMTTQDLITK